jgi:hypothetical protein
MRSYAVCIAHEITSGDQLKEDDMGRIYNSHRERIFCWKKLMENFQLETLGSEEK